MTDNDLMNMPVRDLIIGLRKKAAELSDDHLITVLFSNAVVKRLEMEADRADECEREKKDYYKKYAIEKDNVKLLLECKPSVEALEQIADIMHHMNAPTEYVRALNEWADAVRKADGILGTGKGVTT